MLSSLFIDNIAVIEKANIDFQRGLNILTGETGAGKSIIIDAINAILGQRTSKEIIRTGCDNANVTAVFSDLSTYAQNAIKDLGFSCDEEGKLLLQRQINTKNNNVVKINGISATVSMLRLIGNHLINIHGQHDSQDLYIPENHILIIDSLGIDKELYDEYQKEYSILQQLSVKLKTFTMSKAEKERRIDMLKYQIDELESANIMENEYEELTAKKNRYSNSEKIFKEVAQTNSCINGDENNEGALTLLKLAVDSLRETYKHDEILVSTKSKLQDIYFSLEDMGEWFSNYCDSLDFDPNEIESIESRLDELQKLSRKYGSTTAEMLEFLQQSKNELDQITFNEETISNLRKEIEAQTDKTYMLADKLSECRQKIARTFVKKVSEELEFLDMPKVSLNVRFESVDLYEKGTDKLEFLISANKGEEPRPMAKIASGGELSRIMLAIKNVMAEKDHIDTLIFDEIDTGISGRASQRVGKKLKDVSKAHQIICVTHSPQIAAYADTHLQVAKGIRNDRTYTDVKLLDNEGRILELSRLLGGEKITEITKKNAEELINMSNKQ